MFLRKSLTGRMLIALTCIALLSIIGVGFLAFWMERDVLIQRFSDELRWNADFKQSQLKTWFAERHSDVQFLANSELNRNYVVTLTAKEVDAQEQQTYSALLTDNLRSMQLLRKGYHRLLIADSQGSILASTDAADVGDSIATDPTFRETISSMSGEGVRDIYRETENGPFVMTFSQAIYKPGSGTPKVMANMIGVLILTVNLESTVYPILEDWRWGQTGETILSRTVVSGTQIINPLRFDNISPLASVLPLMVDTTQAKPAQLAARGHEGTQFSIDHRGVPVLTTYRYLPEPRWGLVLKMNTAEILAPLYVLVRHLVQIAIGMLAVAVLGSLVVAKTLIQPLVQLMLATRFVAEGNWQTNLDVEREDEIGEVARSFQEMIGSLRQNQQQIKAANDVARLVLGISSLDEALVDVLNAARTLTGAQLATLVVYDINGFSLPKIISDPHLANLETDAGVVSPGINAISQTLDQHVSLNGTTDLSTWRNHSAFVVRNGSLALPVLGKEKLLGMLRLEQKGSGDGFSQADEETALALSNYLGIALENVRLVSELQKWNRELEQKISERTQALAAANERLQQLDRMKSEFMYSVSHELRNPLSNLKLVLELLQQNIDSPKRTKYLDTLTKQVNLIAQLTEDMLNMIEVEKTREELNFVQVNLNQLVDDVITANRQGTESKGLTLVAEFAEPNIWFEGDYHQIYLATTHVLRNAVNFTHSGAIQVRVTRQETQCCIEVQDSGIGIPPADLPHIFDRFYRGSNVSQSTIPGSGLGLSLVKEVVELHQGRVTLSSQLETGTNFQIWLPISEMPINDILRLGRICDFLNRSKSQILPEQSIEDQQ